MHDCGGVKCEVIFGGMSEGGNSSYEARMVRKD